MKPEDLRFTKSHEWVAVDGDSATVGISDFAVSQLTDLVYAELPAVGTTVEQGEPFGEVESVKAVSDLYAPVSGEVLDANASLAEDTGPLSADPFGDGWMLKVRLSDPSELDGLMDHAAYREHCAAEEH